MRIITGLAFALLFAVTASANFASKIFELESGSAVQTVKAGDTIQTMVFKTQNVGTVTPYLLKGLHCDCVKKDKAGSCTVSGRIPAHTAGGDYDMKLDVEGSINHSIDEMWLKITVIPMSSPIEVISGSKDQTVTAGEPIDTIVFGFKSGLGIDANFPKGVDYS
jgi:hypothetical protein